MERKKLKWKKLWEENIRNYRWNFPGWIRPKWEELRGETVSGNKSGLKRQRKKLPMGMNKSAITSDGKDFEEIISYLEKTQDKKLGRKN